MLSEYSGRALVPGTLRGYRSWRVTLDEGLLMAVNFDYTWQPGENHATCLDWPPTFQTEHQAPQLNCTCGFYACYSPATTQWGQAIPFMGVVELSGRMVLGTRGVRAERARIVASLQPYWPARAAERIKDMYPDVKWFRNHEDMVEAFPPQDVSELIKEEEPTVFAGLVIPNMSGDIIAIDEEKGTLK